MEYCFDNAHKIDNANIMLITIRARRALPANESPVSLVDNNQRPDILPQVLVCLEMREQAI